jgi:LeuA allosteric (dimerisation) domain
VHSVGPGTDGRAEVSIRAHFGGREFGGKCTSHSIVEAAARSYLQAANKAAYEMKRLEDAAAVGSGSVLENKSVDRFFPGGY